MQRENSRKRTNWGLMVKNVEIIKWFKNNRICNYSNTILPQHNYRNPLASQVEGLDFPHELLCHSTTTIKIKSYQKVGFNLPPDHTYRNSVKWRRSPQRQSQTEPLPHGYQRYWKHAKRKIRTNAAKKRVVLNGNIPSAISNTGVTSAAGKESDPFIPTDEVSQKRYIFQLATPQKLVE